MPPADQYCKEYHEQAVAEERMAAQKTKQVAQQVGESVHPPYGQKKCNNCHNKDTDSGFVVPLKDLCAVCHKDFMKGKYHHGPAAVGACLECHLPHNSPNPKLLKLPAGEICDRCHREPRMAGALHAKVKEKGMVCVNCHNPHGGSSPYFLD